MYYFILPVYIRDLGGTILEVGLFCLLMNAIYFSSMFFGGFLADKFDRRKLIILYWITTTPAPLIYSFATNWQHLIPGAVIYNLALLSPAAEAYIATAAPKKRMTRAFALTEAGYSLGMIFSPLLGAYLLTVIDMKWLFRIAFTFYSISTITISFISPQFPKKKRRRSAISDFNIIVRNRRLMSWILLFIPIAFTTSLSTPFISPLLEDVYSFQKPDILVVSSIISAGEATLAAFLGWFGDRYRSTLALVVSLAFIIVGVILLGFPMFSLFLPLATFLIGAEQVMVSLSRSIVGEYSMINLRGTIFGIYMVLFGVGKIFGPYAGAVLYESYPTQPFLYTSISLITLSLLVVAGDTLVSQRKSVLAFETKT